MTTSTPAKPTAAQAEAGNYRMKHIRFQGLDISIETPKGRSRKPGWPKLAADYGYIKRTLGRDGDHVDVFVGPHHDSEMVVVVDQVNQSGIFDEHKCLIGFRDTKAAIETYRKCYTPGWRVGPITTMTIGQFKAWLKDGEQSTMVSKQVSKYAANETQVGNHGDKGRFVTTDDGNRIFITSSGTINRTGEPISGGESKSPSQPPKRNRPASIPKKTMQHPGGGVGIDLEGRLPSQQPGKTSPPQPSPQPSSMPPAQSAPKPPANPRRSPFVQTFAESVLDNIQKFNESQSGLDYNQPAAESHPLHHANLPRQWQHQLLNWHGEAHRMMSGVGMRAQGAKLVSNDPEHIRRAKADEYSKIGQGKIDSHLDALDELILKAKSEGIDLSPHVRHNNLIPREMAARMSQNDPLIRPVNEQERFQAEFARAILVQQFSAAFSQATGIAVEQYAARRKDSPGQLSLFGDGLGGNMLRRPETQKRFDFDRKWDESKHPRDQDGKFASGQGGGSQANAPKSNSSKSFEEHLLGKRAGDTKVVAGRLFKALKEKKHVSIVGETVTSMAELGEVAQVYRDPRFETFRAFFVKDGKVVGHNAYSSREPGIVYVPETVRGKIKSDLDNLKADGFYILHNHPSGNPTPSPEDIRLTVFFHNEFKDKLLGHTIINHKSGTTIDKHGNVAEYKVDNEDLNRTESADIPHDILDQAILSTEALGKIAMSMPPMKDRHVVVMTNIKGRIQVVLDVSDETMKLEQHKILGTLQRIGRLTGAARSFLVLNENSKLEDYKHHAESGAFADIATASGQSMMETMSVRTKQRPDKVRVSETIRESTKYFAQSPIVQRYVAAAAQRHGMTVDEYAARRKYNVQPGQLGLFGDGFGGNSLRRQETQQRFDFRKWDESKHPRDDDGKFTRGSGSPTKGPTPSPEDDKRKSPEELSEEEKQRRRDHWAEMARKQNPETEPKPEPPATVPEPEPTKPEASEPKQAELPLETDKPRESAADRQKQLDADYEFARKSAIGNAGEDLKGSARHRRNQWTSLEDAERNGTAAEMVTRDNLLKNEPHSLAAHVHREPLTAIFLHQVLKAFPAKPGYGKSRETAEQAAKTREEYVEAYRRLKDKAESILKAGEPVDVARQKMQGEVTSIIKDLRAKNYYSAQANGLVNLSNNLGRRYSGLGEKVAKAIMTWKDQNSIPPSEFLDQLADVATTLMEGSKSLDAVLGQSKSKGKTDFKVADLYVAHAERKGGPKSPVGTAREATKWLVESVGMRGIQWGNSVSDDEREHHAKMAADAMLDLADVTGLPLEAISLNGKLGLAIGARGIANALAHYEPSTKVINLTRKNGVGSLAHEWGHAFDHDLGGGESESKTIMSNPHVGFYSEYGGQSFSVDRVDGKYVRSQKDDRENPVYKSMDALRKTWSDSGYENRLRLELRQKVEKKEMSADKAQKYWLSRKEIFARTFERYVQRKLEKSDRKNSYLAGIETKAYKSGGLWPTDEETDKMIPAFDALMDAHRKENLKLTERVKYSAQELAAIHSMIVEMYAARRVKPSPGQQEFQWITVHPPGHEKGQPVMIDKKDGTIKAGMGGKFDGQKISEIGKGKASSGKSNNESADSIAYFNGNKGRRTGKVEMIHGGEFEEIEMLEGKDKGKMKVIPTQKQANADTEKQQDERKRQQEQFRKLKESEDSRNKGRDAAIAKGLGIIDKTPHILTPAQAEGQAANAWHRLNNEERQHFSGYKQFASEVGKAFAKRRSETGDTRTPQQARDDAAKKQGKPEPAKLSPDDRQPGESSRDFFNRRLAMKQKQFEETPADDLIRERDSLIETSGKTKNVSEREMARAKIAKINKELHRRGVREPDENEKAYMEFARKASDVAADPTKATADQLRHADSFIASQQESIKRKANRGEIDKNLAKQQVDSLQSERDWYRSLWKEKEGESETAAKPTPGSAPAAAKPASLDRSSLESMSVPKLKEVFNQQGRESYVDNMMPKSKAELIDKILGFEEKKSGGKSIPAIVKHGEHHFIQPKNAAANGDEVVMVDAKSFDTAWKKDGQYYVGKDGGDKADNFRKWLKSNGGESSPVEMPQVGIGADGRVSFENGRHRFAVMRDNGMESIPVSMSKKDAELYKKQQAKSPSPGIQEAKLSNASAKAGDQLGLIDGEGKHAKAPKFKATELGKAKQQGMFGNLNVNPDQMSMFGGDGTPDELLYKPESQKQESLKKMSADEFSSHISSQSMQSPFSESRVEDWGTMRGQGKRSGGMVMGAMSGAPRGKKTYTDLFSKLPKNESQEANMLERHLQGEYLKARNAGLDHDHAMTWTYEKSGDVEPGFTHAKLNESKPSKDLFSAAQSMHDLIVEYYRAGAGTKSPGSVPKGKNPYGKKGDKSQTTVGSFGDKGRFVTIDGRAVFIEDAKSVAAKRKKRDDAKAPFQPKTIADHAIVDFIGNNKKMVEAFKPYVDNAYKFLNQEAGDTTGALRNVLSAFGHTGKKASAFIGNLRHKRDYTSIAGFDEMAEYAKKYHPELLAGRTGESGAAGDFEQAFFDRLRQGFTSGYAKHSPEVLELASQMAGSSFFDDANWEYNPTEVDDVPFDAYRFATVDRYAAVVDRLSQRGIVLGSHVA